MAKELQDRGEETFVVGRSYKEADHDMGMAIDLAEDQDVQKLTAYINERLSETALKRFFWVTGYGYVGDFANQPTPDVMAKVNYANVLPIAQAAWRKMLASDETTDFVVISSTTAKRVRNNETTYASSKSAQASFAENLGAEAERLNANVKVALFMPGGMRTPFWDEARPESFKGFLDPAKVAKKILEDIEIQQENFISITIERGSL